MTTGKQYIRYILFPLFILFGAGVLYKYIMCHFAASSPVADLICDFSWKDGLFLLCSYSITKLTSPLLNFNTLSKRLLVTLILYCFSFGLIGGPFMFASFFQPLFANVFLHILLLIIIVEFCFIAPWEKS